MLIDDVTITVAAGHGGMGAVAFNTNLMSLGPAGGSGGLGGSVFVEGVSDLSALNNFRYRKVHKAKDGENGRPQFKDGHDGVDITLKVPVGTVIHFLTKRSHTEAGSHETKEGEEREIVRVGERKASRARKRPSGLNSSLSRTLGLSVCRTPENQVY